MKKDLRFYGLSEEECKEITQLYTEYRKLIYSYIREQLSCTSEEAEDFTGDVFARVCRSYKNGHKPTSSVGGWIFKIAGNVCYDFLRNKQRRIPFEHHRHQEEEEEAPADQIPDGNPGPEEIIVKLESQEALLSSLQKLPSDYQKVVKLHYIDGLPLEAIAKKLRISSYTARRRREEGLRQLQKYMVKE